MILVQDISQPINKRNGHKILLLAGSRSVWTDLPTISHPAPFMLLYYTKAKPEVYCLVHSQVYSFLYICPGDDNF